MQLLQADSSIQNHLTFLHKLCFEKKKTYKKTSNNHTKKGICAENLPKTIEHNNSKGVTSTVLTEAFTFWKKKKKKDTPA